MFDKALTTVLHHEGGFVNHPRDPGGMTNLGVTRNTWEAWTGKAAPESEMRALTPAKVTPLYKAHYWDVNRCGEMHPAIALCVFDFGVNAGPGRAARYLQRMIGATADSKVGPGTLGALADFIAQHGAAEAVRQYQRAREGYYRQLLTFDTFGKGWLRRVRDVETEALRLT